MKKKLVFEVLVIIMLSAFHYSFAAEPRLVKVGAFNNFPVLFQDKDGEIKGLYVDILTEIGNKENIRFEYVFGTWTEGLDRIKSGEVDMLTSVAYTEERSKFMDYCQNPLLTVWGELYTLQSSEINSLFDVSGKKIGVMKSDINGRNFQELTRKFNITFEVVELASFEDVFKAIASKNVDAGVSGVTFGAVKQMEYGLRSSGIVFNPLDIFFTTAKGKNQDLIALLDKYLGQWKHQKNSVFSYSKQKWLHGSVGTVAVMPDWLVHAVVITGIIIVIALIFILLLKIQVKKITGRIRQREEALRESEEIFNQFLLHSPVYVFFKDAEIKSLRLSANYEKMLGKPLSELIGKTMEDLFPYDFARKMIEDDKRILHENKVVTIDEEFDGRYYSTIKFPFQIADKTKYLAGFTIDITESKQAEEKIQNLLKEKELILQEVHHRIKNNMNTIKGLLTLQLSAEENPTAAASLRDAESRVQSMIMLYDKLYCSQNYRELPIKDYLQSLTESVIGTFSNRGTVKTKMDIKDFILNVNTLSPVGIIVNELLTNMMKYAFAGRESGLITLSASMNGSRAVIVIQDNGIGIPESISFEKHTGFGLDLVNLLTEQIGGKIKIERGEGTKFILEFDV